MELDGRAYELHELHKHMLVASRVVDDHIVVLDAGALVVLRDATEGVEEETVTELHDVGLVHARNFLRVHAR